MLIEGVQFLRQCCLKLNSVTYYTSADSVLIINYPITKNEFS